MSTFVKRLNRDPAGAATYMKFSDFLRHGFMRALTIRLPASTLAKLDELFDRCPGAWRSRQELVFEMIEASVQDYVDSQADPTAVATAFQEVARKALQRTRLEENDVPMPVTSDTIEEEDIENFTTFVSGAIPGVPTTEFKKELRRMLKESRGRSLPVPFVCNWLAKTGWAAPGQVEAMFADEESFAVGEHSFLLRYKESSDRCEVLVFRDNLPVNPTGPRTYSVNSPFYRRWIGRLSIRRTLLGNLRLKVIPTDKKNHEGFVYRILD